MTGQCEAVPSARWLSAKAPPEGGASRPRRRSLPAGGSRIQQLASAAPPSGRTTAMCPHVPPCPEADAADREAARAIACHPEQGWSLLGNGVVVFDDGGEILPSGRVVPPPTARRSHPRPTAQSVPASARPVTYAGGPSRVTAGKEGGQDRFARLAMRLFELLSQPMKPPPDGCPACAGETRLEGIGYRSAWPTVATIPVRSDGEADAMAGRDGRGRLGRVRGLPVRVAPGAAMARPDRLRGVRAALGAGRCRHSCRPVGVGEPAPATEVRSCTDSVVEAQVVSGSLARQRRQPDRIPGTTVGRRREAPMSGRSGRRATTRPAPADI